MNYYKIKYSSHQRNCIAATKRPYTVYNITMLGLIFLM